MLDFEYVCYVIIVTGGSNLMVRLGALFLVPLRSLVR